MFYLFGGPSITEICEENARSTASNWLSLRPNGKIKPHGESRFTLSWTVCMQGGIRMRNYFLYLPKDILIDISVITTGIKNTFISHPTQVIKHGMLCKCWTLLKVKAGRFHDVGSFTLAVINSSIFITIYNNQFSPGCYSVPFPFEENISQIYSWRYLTYRKRTSIFSPAAKWQVSITSLSSFPAHSVQSVILWVLFSPSTQIVTIFLLRNYHLTYGKLLRHSRY